MTPHSRRLTDDDLAALGQHCALIARTFPWFTTDRESPGQHPWVDVWGGDGDLLLEVGDNLAYDVFSPDLAKALIAVVSAAQSLLAEVHRVRTLGGLSG